jgi:hypothetical protein
MIIWSQMDGFIHVKQEHSTVPELRGGAAIYRHSRTGGCSCECASSQVAMEAFSIAWKDARLPAEAEGVA